MMTSSAADRGLPAAPFLFATTVLLTFLTLLHFHGTPRFQAAGPGVTFLADAPMLLSGSGGDATPDRVEFRYRLTDTRFVRVSARLSADDIVQGKRRWQQGRLVALQLGSDDRPRPDLPHVVVRLAGTSPARSHASIFRIDDDGGQLLLRAEVLGTVGFLRVSRIQVQPLNERPGFASGSVFIASCWIFLGLAISVWVFLSVLRRRFRPLLAYIVAAPALLLSVLPATTTAPLRLGVARRIDLSGAMEVTGRAADAALSTNLFSLAKTGHVVMFAAVGFSFAIALGFGRAGRGLGLALCFGLVAEMLQLFSPNRTATLFDVGLNLTSAAGGVLIATCAMYFGNRIRRRRPG